jgi:hypothetical protein
MIRTTPYINKKKAIESGGEDFGPRDLPMHCLHSL